MGLVKVKSMLRSAVQWWEVGLLALILGTCIHAFTGSIPTAVFAGGILYYLMMELRFRTRGPAAPVTVSMDPRFPLRTQLLLPNAQLVGASRLSDDSLPGGLVLDVICGHGSERSFSLASGSVEEHPVGAWAGPVYLPGVDTVSDPTELLLMVDQWVQEGSPVDVALELQPGPGGTLRQTSVQIDNGASRLSLTVL